MSEAEFMHQYEVDYDEEEIRILDRMDDYYHKDKNGNWVDVRKINPQYASNLYKWYLRNYGMYGILETDLMDGLRQSMKRGDSK